MTKVMEGLESNGLIEDDKGPYGSLVVLAQKAGQDMVHWSNYVFRLCVSYKSLNAIMCPFIYPLQCCDDAV